MKDAIVGIDLGTGASVVSVFENGEAKVIVNEEGERTTPSIVSYTADGEIIVGSAAKRQAITNPFNTVFAAKRLMGNRYDELTVVEKSFPYKIRSGNNDMAVIEINGNTLTPQEIGAKVLQKLKKAAENYLGHEVKRAVITCPAFFNDSQRQATKDAGEIAGFKVERVIAEPTAAALAFGLGKNKKGIYAVYDFGSGTFDCSILDIDGDVIETLSTSGDVYLGGTDLDSEIIKWMATEFKKTDGIDLTKDKAALQRLKDSAEKAKIELSTVPSASINIPFITADATGPRHLTLALSRAQFEKIAETYIAKTIECCKRALLDAKKDKSEITEVLLVGGSSRIPLVQKMVKDFFGQEPNKSLNPDEAVAIGASIQAGVLAGDVTDLLLLDVCPLTLSVETYGGIATPIVDRNTTIPTRKSQLFSTAADGQTSVEIVVLQGERKLSKDNRLLGRFHLDGIPSAPRGVPQIEVSYDLDANGILSVSAKDKATNKEQMITITASSGLSKEEVARMQDEAKQFEEEDKQKVEYIALRNNAETLVYSTEKTLQENESKIPDDVRADVRMKTDALKEVLKNKENDRLKASHDELMQVSFKMAEALYKTADPTVAPEASSATPPNEVIDAEVVA